MAAPSPRAIKLNEKRLQLRRKYWPDIPDELLWLRKDKKGFITIPRAMPLLLSIIDDMSKHKPLSSTYLSLWCRSFDDCMITITSPHQLAFESGFGGQRGQQTWLGRMSRLEQLNFIKAKPGANGPYSYVLLLNPYMVLKSIHATGTEKIVEAKLNALLSRVSEIGADDLEALTLSNT